MKCLCILGILASLATAQAATILSTTTKDDPSTLTSGGYGAYYGFSFDLDHMLVSSGSGIAQNSTVYLQSLDIAKATNRADANNGLYVTIFSSATTKNPARQALVSMTGTFWDTVVVCAITGLMLMTTLLANPELSTAIANGTISSGAGLATAAFEKIPVFGPLVLLVGLVTFAYSTILGWSYYGERCWVYLCGVKSIMPFRVVWTFVVLVGCVAALDVVWNVADVLNACMAFPNCVALIGLSGVIASETKKYVWDKNAEMGGLMKWMDDVAPQLDK